MDVPPIAPPVLVPAGQAVQDVEPVVLLYVSTGQLLHAVPALEPW